MTRRNLFACAPMGGYARDKMPRAADDELTQIGPGTPCGEYFRRFWLPVALTSELADVPLRVRILGEDLVLFRDLSGELGLLELHCPHRGASLEYGKIRDHGIACCYHGWHFAVDGTILEMPTHGADATLEERLFQGAYPVHEYAGMVFAYMGPPERKPPFPVYDVHRQPAVSHSLDKTHSPCNWLQIRENGMDPLHTAFLHAEHVFPEAMTDLALMTFEESPLGLMYLTTRRHGEMIYFRQNETVLPTTALVNGLEDAQGETIFDRRGGMTEWVVPVDETNSLSFRMYYVLEFDHQPPSGMDGRWDRDRSAAAGFGEPAYQASSGQSGDRPYAERQRSAGDWDAWTSQGPIHTHEDENLGVTDAGVMTYRRLIRREIRKVRDGQDLVGLVREVDGPIRTHVHNTVMRVPEAPTPAADRQLCEAFQRAFFDKTMRGELRQDLSGEEKLRIAAEVVRRLIGA